MQLLIIPTAFERERIPLELRQRWTDAGNAIALCGFGMAIAGVRTVQEVRKHSPAQVVLLGIAGSYTSQIGVGTACEFSKVSCYGVGVGNGESFVSASTMGWSQWAGPPEIRDQIELDPVEESGLELLTVTASSSGSEEADWKIKQYPAAVAEDMEGFSVAAACLLESIPVRIVRGISNFAGDRDHRNWQIDNALHAAMQHLLNTTLKG